MLRLQRDLRKAHEVTLHLQGRIASDWVDVLERECEELSRSGFRIELDFSDVVFIDRSGFAALSRLTGAGIEIIGCSPLVAAMLAQEGIAAKSEIRSPLKGF